MANSSQRVRGVRASRRKLDAALAHSNLERKTQVYLAERIADMEGLSAVPKDLVNRVFREQSVDPQSIERVAAALEVPAHTLYLTENDVAESASSGRAQAEAADDGANSRPAKPLLPRWAMALGALMIATGALTYWQAQPGACELTAEPGKIGIIVARFTGDTDGSAQHFLSNLFTQDADLQSALSVLRGCSSYSDQGPGDIQRQVRDLRAQAREKLKQSGAHLLLWGNRFGNTLNVRFVSSIPDSSPRSLTIDGKPVAVSEPYIEIKLDLTRPQGNTTELKRMALSLVQTEDRGLNRLRDDALHAYQTSFEWLRRSILADRNLRGSLNKATKQQQWAIVSAQLCYKYRLLGDYEGDPNNYRQAVAACEDMLEVRDKDQYPLDWAATKTNLASAHIRLHLFAESGEEAQDHLSLATRLLEEAAGSIDVADAPQLWALNRRNLGTLYVRLAGMAADDAELMAHHDRALAYLEEALTYMEPSFQPQDWGDTQQNICILSYQTGGRLKGAEGITMVRKAIGHCEEALDWLSAESTPLSWARAQNNLAASNAVLAELTKNSQQLLSAERAFTQAKRVYRKDRLPLNWAEVEVNLGQLNCTLAQMQHDQSRLLTARQHTEQALAVFLDLNHRYSDLAETLLDAIISCENDLWDNCRCGS